jgi:hypothetical protein
VIVDGDGRLALKNVVVAGPVARGVVCKGNGRLSLERVTLRNCDGPGLALFSSASATLNECLVTGNRTHGIELHDRSSLQLNDTALAGNGQSGLAVFDTAAAVAKRSRASSNGDWNLILSQESQIRWEDGYLGRSRFAQSDVSGSATLTLTGATLEDGERFGLFATGQATVRVHGSRITGHGSRGIELQDNARLDLEKTRVESSGDYGLLLFGRSQVTAKECVFAANGAHGVSFRGYTRGKLSNCAFISNRYSGVGCLDAGDGGAVCVSRCTFEGNGMRPIYRGPLHLEPLVPTPLSIDGPIVHCLADAGAEIEMYLDDVGQGRRYLRTIRADGRGRFDVDCRDVPTGKVLTAAATVNGSTSEFNVVAGPTCEPILAALLTQTGPLSDAGGLTRLDARIRRWPAGTHLVFHLADLPSRPVEQYARFFTRQIAVWTRGAVTADLHFGSRSPPPNGVAVIPVRYLPPDSPALKGRGGVTLLKWDGDGWFVRPLEILLATGDDPRETCPRVMAHEIGHTLGLCHASVGLLPRMQGTVPPRHAELTNDFSPTLTFYDVQALQILYGRQTPAGASLGQLVEAGLIPGTANTAVAQIGSPPAQPAFSPAAPATPMIPDERRQP